MQSEHHSAASGCCPAKRKLDHAVSHNLTPFISMQDHHSLLYREEEREMFPSAKASLDFLLLIFPNIAVSIAEAARRSILVSASYLGLPSHAGCSRARLVRRRDAARSIGEPPNALLLPAPMDLCLGSIIKECDLGEGTSEILNRLVPGSCDSCV